MDEVSAGVGAAGAGDRADVMGGVAAPGPHGQPVLAGFPHRGRICVEDEPAAEMEGVLRDRFGHVGTTTQELQFKDAGGCLKPRTLAAL